MPSSAFWRRVHLVKTEVLEERITSIISVERIGKLRTTLAVLLVTANVVPSSLILSI
jgi:hypothetical protein